MSRDTICLYHNPRCSKSRSALTLLEEHACEAQVIEYLKAPPTKAQLKQLLKKLGLKPEQLLRKGEAVFKEHYAGRALSDDDCLNAMVEHPVLIERPIFVKGDRAVVGRPPERVLELL